MIESVRYADRGDFFELTLSAPQQRNAIGMREVQAVKAAIATIPESCRLLVVRSEGPVFCMANSNAVCNKFLIISTANSKVIKSKV